MTVCAKGLLFMYLLILMESQGATRAWGGGQPWVGIPNCSNRCPAWSGENKNKISRGYESLLDLVRIVCMKGLILQSLQVILRFSKYFGDMFDTGNYLKHHMCMRMG